MHSALHEIKSDKSIIHSMTQSESSDLEEN